MVSDLINDFLFEKESIYLKLFLFIPCISYTARINYIILTQLNLTVSLLLVNGHIFMLL